jgi:hypothetical protein
MKLQVFAVDFEEHTITFRMASDIMEGRAFGSGIAEVDIDAISQTLEDRAAGKPLSGAGTDAQLAKG